MRVVVVAEAFLSEAWLAELAERGRGLPEADGPDMVIQHEIAGAPDGKVRFTTEWRGGRLSSARLGKHPDPDVTIQAKAPDAVRVLRGELSPEVAFMQGRLKVDGDYRRLLVDLREWRHSAPYRQLWSDMADLTAD